MNIGFIGAGNMAEALIKGILGAQLYQPSQVYISDPAEDRRSSLKKQYGISTIAHNRDLVATADTVVLAVKPQVAEQVLSDISERMDSSDQVVRRQGTCLDFNHGWKNHGVVARFF